MVKITVFFLIEMGTAGMTTVTAVNNSYTVVKQYNVSSNLFNAFY